MWRLEMDELREKATAEAIARFYEREKPRMHNPWKLIGGILMLAAAGWAFSWLWLAL